MTSGPVLETTGYELPVFDPVVPAAVVSGERERRTVVIVGGGVTGLTLAADLSLRGIDAVLLDDDVTVGVRGASSRGMCYAQKTLEIMDGLGVYDRMLAKGVVWSVGRTLSGDDVVYVFDRAGGNASAQAPFVNLQQFYVEWFLVDRIAELGAVELRWGNKVVGIEPAADHVDLDVDTPGGSYRVRADWVVDATGANSPLRERLALPMTAAHAVDHWCICDARFTKDLPAERWTWVDAPFNADRAVWQHPMADNVWRLDYQLGPDADPLAAADPAVAQARVAAHLGPDTPFELVWVGPWQYRAQLVDQMVHGRLILAGDAAHVMSPFGARGGNSGIHDADNLGWKLALVTQGKAGPALIETYHQERQPAAAENIRVTSQTSRFLAPESDFERRLRSAAIGLAREHVFARMLVNTGRLSQPNLYPASAAIGTRGGFSLPNMVLGDGRTLAATVRGEGTSFLALHLGEAPNLPAGLPAKALELDDPSGELVRLTGLAAGEVLLVRPDLYCAAVVPVAEAARALAMICGAPELAEAA
ncbi:MAG: FAD-binding monooxygenase [Bradyrhizobium sp.]|nr:FAD-binding monooxygenase [Bradyrhizobium sp.]